MKKQQSLNFISLLSNGWQCFASFVPPASKIGFFARPSINLGCQKILSTMAWQAKAVLVLTLLAFEFFTSAMAATLATGEALNRQAELGFRWQYDDGPVVTVQQVQEGSLAAQAGLQVGDRILAVNNNSFKQGFKFDAQLQKLRANQLLSLKVSRNKKAAEQEAKIQFKPEAKVKEQIPGVRSHYRSVIVNDGSHLRAIITQPSGTNRPLPALLFTQWVSCGSIEYRAGSNGAEILAALARHSGRALVRVERSSSGDSSGPACHELDYNTELQHYFEAYQALLNDPLIADTGVVILGSSLGSTMAPLLAQRLQEAGIQVTGVIIQGGGALTYYERMLNFDRIYLERREQASFETIHQEILNRSRFHYEYLIRQRHPDDIAKDDSSMAEVRSHIFGLGSGHHYGRPYRWHQQAAQHNFLAAWLKLDAQVLVIFNAYEQFETRHGHQLIVEAINQITPNHASYMEQAAVGHSNNRYDNIYDAYRWQGGQSQASETAQIMLDWLASKL